MPRTLIETTATYRRYRVTNAQGKIVGEDIESLVPAEVNAADLATKAANAININKTFLNIASPTAAQVTSHVQNLTRENTALIKLMLGLLEDTSGT